MSSSAPIILGGVFIPPVQTNQMDAEAKKKRDEARKQRLDSFKKRVFESSSIAKEIIEASMAKGVGICFDSDLGGCLGCFSPSMNVVCLNEKMKDEQLLSTLVHECQHSLQTPEQGMENTGKGYISSVRALEADAMAHQCAALYQMQKKEPEAFNDFMKSHGGIMMAYTQEFYKTKDANKAKAAAFKAWYADAKYVEKYDHSCCEFLEQGMMYSGAYKKDVSSEKLAEKFSYVPEEFFKSKEANTVSEQTAKDIASIEKAHIRHALNWFNRSNIKVSCDDFYVRDQKGEVHPPKNQVKAALLKNKAMSR
ncbi:MAG: hypothetical protein MJ247_03350 [Alphaproteobacteria bacterium]|nr:hypothetical protein [Alphaproteobacteria bacterium]